MQRHRQKTNGYTPVKDGDSASSSSDTNGRCHSKKQRQHSWTLLSPRNVFLALLFIVYVVVPIAFSSSSFIRCHVIFLNWFNLQYSKNLSDPASYGLNCTRSFDITSPSGKVRIGAWHIMPKSLHSKCSDDTIDPTIEFQDDRPVILYLHGNGGTRGGNHRLQLYKVLAYGVVDAHVITIDYRGYGDSMNEDPTADGVTEDALTAFQWLTSQISPSRILIWGHSLGTGVAVRLGTILSKGDKHPKGYVLESPFCSIPRAVRVHPLTIFYQYLPSVYMDYFFVNPTRDDVKIQFDSEHNIDELNSPVLIFHAKDDEIVPYELGYTLYKAGCKTKGDKDLKFISFEAHHGYGHKHIWRDDKLPSYIQEFLNQ